jgi:hypothetical protein
VKDFDLSAGQIARKDYSSVRDKSRSWVESDLQVRLSVFSRICILEPDKVNIG